MICAIVNYLPWVGRALKRVLSGGPGSRHSAQPHQGHSDCDGVELIQTLRGAPAPSFNMSPLAGPTPDYPVEKRVDDLFIERVEENPHDTAIVLPNESLNSHCLVSYAMLNALVEQLACGLNEVGVSAGTIGALLLDRCLAQVVAVFAVLRSGAAFLPLDPAAPIENKQILLRDAKSAVLISTTNDASAMELASTFGIICCLLTCDGAFDRFEYPCVPCQQVPLFPGCRIRPGAKDASMLIFTSGTTGNPKGIIYDHAHLMHGVWFFAEQCCVTNLSTCLLKSPYIWAVVEWELFPCLTRGGKLVIADPTGHTRPQYMVELIGQEAITTLMITPQVLEILLDVHERGQGGATLSSLQHVASVGEPLLTSLANRWVSARGVHARLHNFYGTSETSCTVYTVPPTGVDQGLFPHIAPVGLPQPHSKVWLATVGYQGTLEPVDDNEVGEICFGGIQAAGYWMDEFQTNKKWAMTKHGRLHRTGDLGRWRGGVLEVIGRGDRQLKLRGVRIEPEGVEAVVKQFASTHEGEVDIEGERLPTKRKDAVVVEAAVVATKDPALLVAFLRLRDVMTRPDEQLLRSHCQRHLAPSHVPAIYVTLSTFPRLANGKTDFVKLADLAREHAEEVGVEIMDSLGRMRKASRSDMVEQAVFHRCYAIWMFATYIDHWMYCNGFCAYLAFGAVPVWAEVMVASFGGYHAMYGFTIVAAYLHSGELTPSNTIRTSFEKYLIIFMLYLFLGFPLPLLWVLYKEKSSALDAVRLAMEKWFLMMMLISRLLLRMCERLRVPVLLQVVLAAAVDNFMIYVVVPLHNDGSAWAKPNSWAAYWLSFLFYWLTPATWVQFIMVLYTLAFHFARPIACHLAQRAPCTRRSIWGVASVGASASLRLLVVLCCPAQELETVQANRPLFFVATVIQVGLLMFGVSSVPLDMSLWGNSTIGAYAFSMYCDPFRLSVSGRLPEILAQWDTSGVLIVIVMPILCFLGQTFNGIVGTRILVAPIRALHLLD